MDETTTPKPFVFVLMPFDPAFDDVYKLGIKAACKDAGGYCERVDEQIFDDSILERVYNQISKADLLIADLTGRNPNVFYEVGYAHALGKRPILLTQKAEDIPFDLKHYPHIVYGGKIAELKDELERRVRFALEQPKRFQESVQRRIDVFVGGVRIVGEPTLDSGFESVGSRIRFVVNITNLADRTIQPLSFESGVVSNSKIAACHWLMDNSPSRVCETTMFPLPGKDQRLFSFSRSVCLMPGAWQRIKIELIPARILHSDEIIDLSVRLFTESGPEDFAFKLRIGTVT